MSEINDRNNTAQSEILADFRQAWHEAMIGETIPLSQLWEDIELSLADYSE